jgi:cysteinyl-tRNA synthetase
MPKLRLYNTLTRTQEIFAPIDLKRVRFYVCGPTVYDFAHIGNARPVVLFDILFRLLRKTYGAAHVIYVRNITDVDDKIMARAAESGEPITALTARTTAAFHADMAALNCLNPSLEPRATEHIAEMQTMIAGLIQSGHAYEAQGHVLFHVPSMPDYGALSRRSPEELIAGARVEVAPYKKSPADFILWKPSTDEQVGWDSPWGRGRPGWHIECSAMAAKHLGESFDLHGGGLDLIFPHHENEIAQSRCAHNDAPPARTWLHNGFVTVNGEKMSKSLGNFFTVHDLRQRYHGEVIRLSLMMTHYRQPLDFTEQLLQQAKATLDRWYGALRRVSAVTGNYHAPHTWIDAHLHDDLNIPEALTAIHELVDRLNKLPLELENEERNQAIIMARGVILDAGALLGLLQSDPEAWFQWQPETTKAGDETIIADLIAARQQARSAKNFKRADELRDELLAKGIVLEDKADGSVLWRRA